MDIKKARTVKVTLEEHLAKELDIEIPDNISDDDANDYALEKAEEMYKNKEIVLTKDDYNGNTLVSSESTEWYQIY